MELILRLTIIILLWTAGIAQAMGPGFLMAYSGRSPRYGTNLLDNPGFEDGVLTPWYLVNNGDGTATVVNTTARSGLYSAELSSTTGDYNEIYQIVQVTSGRTYKFGGYVKVTASTSGTVYFRATSGATEYVDTLHVSTVSQNWVPLTGEILIPDGETTAYIYCKTDDDTTVNITFYVDDVYMKEVL